jgi:hypothetical protein
MQSYNNTKREGKTCKRVWRRSWETDEQAWFLDD